MAILPAGVGAEIGQLWNKYKFDHVHFQDETFFTNKKRVQEVAQEFINRQLPITWFGTMRADQGVRLDDETWQLCKQSGLKKIMIGMEAGTQQMLDWMQKDIKLEHIFETAEKCVTIILPLSSASLWVSQASVRKVYWRHWKLLKSYAG
ncbi:MAG: hypothetical protein WDM78_14725 [Puia sp.]